MTEDSEYLARKTWARVIDPVTKAGFMDGAADGQTSVFQQSFNTGYEQGLQFGFQLGFEDALSSVKGSNLSSQNLGDTRKINCQICTNGVKLQENIGNLYNIQKERNSEYLSSCNIKS